jgi:hypothetical protein
MPYFLLRVAVGLAVAPMAWYIEPWNLRWFAYDVGFGALLFAAMHICMPVRYSLRDAGTWLVAAAILWGIAMYVARQHGVAPAELGELDDINRAWRRMPDIAVSTLAFAALTAALAAINPPPRPPDAARAD